MAKGNARVFQMTAEEARNQDDVVTGMFPVNHTYARVLFDSGANKSFVSSTFMSCLGGKIVKLIAPCNVEIASGQEVKVDTTLKDCYLKIREQVIPLELLPMKLGGFDIVLGMDWLSKNGAHINCVQKSLEITLPDGQKAEIQGEPSHNPSKIISMIRANKYLQQGVKVTGCT